MGKRCQRGWQIVRGCLKITSSFLSGSVEKEDEKQESEGDIDQEQSSEKDQVLVTRSKDTGGIRTRRRGQGGRSLPCKRKTLFTHKC